MAHTPPQSKNTPPHSITLLTSHHLNKNLLKLKAYADYNDLMDLTEKLFSDMVLEINGARSALV